MAEEKTIKPSSDFSNKEKRQDKKTEQSLEACENKCAELELKYKRALADYQNLLKTSAKEKESFIRYSNEGLLGEIIPVFDNLKMAFGHIDKEAEKNAWLKGLSYVIKQFRDVLAANGVEEIETVGKAFDPDLMEAVEGEGEKVIKELKPGYKLNGKVLVAPKVALGD